MVNSYMPTGDPHGSRTRTPPLDKRSFCQLNFRAVSDPTGSRTPTFSSTGRDASRYNMGPRWPAYTTGPFVIVNPKMCVGIEPIGCRVAAGQGPQPHWIASHIATRTTACPLKLSSHSPSPLRASHRRRLAFLAGTRRRRTTGIQSTTHASTCSSPWPS